MSTVAPPATVGKLLVIPDLPAFVAASTGGARGATGGGQPGDHSHSGVPGNPSVQQSSRQTFSKYAWLYRVMPK